MNIFDSFKLMNRELFLSNLRVSDIFMGYFMIDLKHTNSTIIWIFGKL